MDSTNQHIEREVKFLEIDLAQIKTKLAQLGATDLGEKLLSEVIFYVGDGNSVERKSRKYVRIRDTGEKIFLTYKHLPDTPAIGVTEIELEINSAAEGQLMLETLGWQPARVQEKRRHSFKLGKVMVDIDTWPGQVPPYLEIEGNSEDDIKEAANLLGLDWDKHELRSAAGVLKEFYNIDMWQLTKYTFSEIK